MTGFKFSLNAAVVIECSGEEGTIVGRWESTSAEPRYLVRYKAADGRAIETWWDEEALTDPA